MGKKKSNSRNNPTKTQHQLADAVKLDNLKSLNAILLKDIVYLRHQVDSLTQINVSPESHKASLESELTILSERTEMLEFEKELLCPVVFAQLTEMADLSRRRIAELERDAETIVTEKKGKSVSKMQKSKRVWAMVTSATTVLAAAVSYTYVSRRSC